MITLDDDLSMRSVAVQAMNWYGNLAIEEKIEYINNLTYSQVQRLINAADTFIAYQMITRSIGFSDDFDPLVLEDLISRVHSRAIREGW